MSAPVALIVVPVSNLAGVARHVVDLVRVGVPGWRLVVTCPEGPLVEKAKDAGGAVVVANIGPEASTGTAVRSLRRVIETLRPAVVHSHLARADILVALSSHRSAVRLVSTEHHISPDPLMFHSNKLRARTMQAVHHLRLRRFSALVAVSSSTMRDMERFWRPKQRIVVIRNGVDRRLLNEARPAGLRLLSLARLSQEKNIEMAIRVLGRVVKEHPGARLTIAGEGPERAKLETLARDLHLEGAVSFPGFVNPMAAMESHDVIVQPSKSDNLSYSLLDAVAGGMGVVASPIGGNPEILPARCIASLSDEADFAAKVIEQGLQPDRRPVLPETIPTVREMAELVGHIYDSVLER